MANWDTPSDCVNEVSLDHGGQRGAVGTKIKGTKSMSRIVTIVAQNAIDGRKPRPLDMLVDLTSRMHRFTIRTTPLFSPSSIDMVNGQKHIIRDSATYTSSTVGAHDLGANPCSMLTLLFRSSFFDYRFYTVLACRHVIATAMMTIKALQWLYGAALRTATLSAGDGQLKYRTSLVPTTTFDLPRLITRTTILFPSSERGFLNKMESPRTPPHSEWGVIGFFCVWHSPKLSQRLVNTNA